MFGQFLLQATCQSYSGAFRFVNAAEQGNFRDFILCPWQTQMGGPAFAAIVMLGIVNIPIYQRQGSALVPVLLTLILSGIVLTQVASVAQSVIIVALLLVLGLGPILLIRRVQLA